MALYGISQEGSDSMRKLSDDLLSSSAGLADANRALKQNISTCMGELGVYGTEIWALALQLDGLLQDKVESFELLAQQARIKADEILELIGFSSSSGVGSNSANTQGASSSYHRTSESIEGIAGWIKEVNPNYHSPFLPPGKNPFHVNCGSCAFAVESRLLGTDSSAVASADNIGTDAGMEAATGKKCVYMSPESIEQKLRSIGAGAHLIVGINRHPTPMGKPQSGHWFNVYFDGNQIYTIDGQSGSILDWPHDYIDVSEWCAMV